MKLSGAILYVRDVRETLSFYERAFGLKRRFLSDDASFGDVETGGAVLGFASVAQSKKNFLGGVHGTDPDAAPPAFEVWLSTDDVEGAFRRAVAAGAIPLTKPEVKPWGQTVAFVRDDDGHVVEISSPWAP